MELSSINEFLWTEKYRPKKVCDIILPDSIKKVFQQFVDQKNIPNLILTGTAGVGKTTVARAMLEELGCDYIVINGSMNGNIDTLRNEIMNFASSVSLMGGRKYVILDEADYLNANSTQPALRNFMEEFSSNCGFILTCNFKSRIIEPLHSRCSVIDFKLQKSDRAEMAKLFMARLSLILKAEDVEFETAALVGLITKFFPDWRRVLNEAQRYSATGKIDSGILVDVKEMSINKLIASMKDKDFTNVRKWVGENSDMETHTLFRKFYDSCVDFLTQDSIPQLILILAKYQYQAAFVADHEINIVSCLLEIMIDCTFK